MMKENRNNLSTEIIKLKIGIANSIKKYINK